MMQKERERKKESEKGEQDKEMQTKGLLCFQWWFLVARKRRVHVAQTKEKKNKFAPKTYFIFVVVGSCAR